MSVLEEVRDNLVDSRARLVIERTRIDRAIAGIDQALSTMDRSGTAVEARVTIKQPAAGGVDGKAEIRRRIEDKLRAAHPTGLTNLQLAESIAPEWPEGDVTPARIAANARQMSQAGEIVGDGARWYWVPAEAESGPAPDGG
jgi:hypothetical protein